MIFGVDEKTEDDVLIHMLQYVVTTLQKLMHLAESRGMTVMLSFVPRAGAMGVTITTSSPADIVAANKKARERLAATINRKPEDLPE